MNPHPAGVAPIVAAAAIAVLGGCASGGLPVTHYYTLGAPIAVPAGARGGPGLTSDDGSGGIAGAAGVVLAVQTLEVVTPYDQDRLVYRKSVDSTEVGFYAYHRWAAPVGRLAQVALVESLRGAQGVAQVRVLDSQIRPDLVLGGSVRQLEELDGTALQSVRVAVELWLRNASGEEVWSEVFDGSESGDYSDGGDVARAFHGVFERLMSETREALEAAIAQDAR